MRLQCKYCRSTGKDPFHPGVCPVCKGRGTIPFTHEKDTVSCSFCNATGKDPYEIGTCRICKGLAYTFRNDYAPIEVHYITGGKPYTDRRTIEDILGNLKGELRIVETFFGKGTLDLLRSIPASCNTRVLIKNLSDISVNDIQNFKKEFPNFLFKKMPYDLHDRYIIDDTGFLLLGHGLKDIGNSQSFAVLIEKILIQDIIQNIIQNFDDKWSKASDI